MKRLFQLLVLALVATCVCLAADAKGKKASSYGTVYYVVVGSFDSLDEAHQFLYSCADWLAGPVYKAKANGKTVYRVSPNCYRSKKEAREHVEQLKQNGFSAWVWPSKGLADCVERGIGLDGEPYNLTPQ